MTATNQHHIIALSGGKDSTAMALRLAELEPNISKHYICNPTGDELPDMQAHWRILEKMLGQPIEYVSNHTLEFWTKEFSALPNSRMRWCTRLLKIEPTLAYLKQYTGAILCVGLRADEPLREGIYSADITNRFPLREWGWGISEVKKYLKSKNIKIPERTDCARCYGQRLVEWKNLLRKHPSIYAHAEAQEKKYGHTFRSEKRDTWPADLEHLRIEFEKGRIPKGEKLQFSLFPEEEQEQEDSGCRICKL